MEQTRTSALRVMAALLAALLAAACLAAPAAQASAAEGGDLQAGGAQVQAQAAKATTIYANSATKGTATLKAKGLKASKAKWSTSKKAVATVSKKGVVTAKKAGKATITAKQGKKTYKFSVVVKNVTINKKAVTLQKGKTFALKLTGDAIKAAKTSNAKVATVTKAGKVKAVGSSVKPGKSAAATVTLTSKKGRKYSCKVTVKAPAIAVKSVSLKKAKLSLEVGKKFANPATVSPANATNKKVTYASSNKKVATVDAKGTVTAVAAGTATITATTADGKKKATCKVIVTAPNVAVSSVAFGEAGYQMALGKTAANPAVVSPSNATNKKVTYTSSDERVATVDAKGTITAVSTGAATITAKTADGGKTTTCNVTVKEPYFDEDSHVISLAANSVVRNAFFDPSGDTIVNIFATTTDIDTVKANLSVKVDGKKADLNVYEDDDSGDQIIRISSSDFTESFVFGVSRDWSDVGITSIKTNKVVTGADFGYGTDFYGGVKRIITLHVTTDDEETIVKNLDITLGSKNASWSYQYPGEMEDRAICVYDGEDTCAYYVELAIDWQGLEVTSIGTNSVVTGADIGDSIIEVYATTTDLEKVKANLNVTLGKQGAKWNVSDDAGDYDTDYYSLYVTEGGKSHRYTLYIRRDWAGLEVTSINTNEVVTTADIYDNEISIVSTTDDVDELKANLEVTLGDEEASWDICTETEDNSEPTYYLTVSKGDEVRTYRLSIAVDWQDLVVESIATNDVVVEAYYSDTSDNITIYASTSDFATIKNNLEVTFVCGDAKWDIYEKTDGDERNCYLEVSDGQRTHTYRVKLKRDQSGFGVKSIGTNAVVTYAEVGEWDDRINIKALVDDIDTIKANLDVELLCDTDSWDIVYDEEWETYSLAVSDGRDVREYELSISRDWQGLEVSSIETNDVVTDYSIGERYIDLYASTTDIDVVKANLKLTIDREGASWDIRYDESSGQNVLEVTDGNDTHTYYLYFSE